MITLILYIFFIQNKFNKNKIGKIQSLYVLNFRSQNFLKIKCIFYNYLNAVIILQN